MGKRRNAITLAETKEGFMTLCKQYEHMGKLMTLLAKTLKHPIFAPSSAPAVFNRINQQYEETGEQLKEIGIGLDALGGKPVTESSQQKKDRKKKELKQMSDDEKEKDNEDVVEEMKDTHEGQKFVSNIQPDDNDIGRTKEGKE